MRNTTSNRMEEGKTALGKTDKMNRKTVAVQFHQLCFSAVWPTTIYAFCVLFTFCALDYGICV